MNRDSALATRRLQHPTTIAQAQPWQTDAVTLESPALLVMTDLTKVKAATTSPATAAATAITGRIADVRQLVPGRA